MLLYNQHLIQITGTRRKSDVSLARTRSTIEYEGSQGRSSTLELTKGLRYKLRMMGVPLDGPAHIMADNQSVIKNSSTPESMLKKKSNSIAYHYVRERVAAGVCGITYEPTASNLADMLTKIQSGSTRSHLASQVLY